MSVQSNAANFGDGIWETRLSSINASVFSVCFSPYLLTRVVSRYFVHMLHDVRFATRTKQRAIQVCEEDGNKSSAWLQATTW